TAIIGTGPAGLSAALNLKIHNKSFIWIGSKNLSDKVTKAEQISNYPGFINASGDELNAAFQAQIAAMELPITEGMVNAIYPMGDHFALAIGADFAEAKTLILATGVAPGNVLPGEADLLGRGVSYCATCDGMLYKGKKIAVICGNPRFEHEVQYLAEIAEKVWYYMPYKNGPEFGGNTEKLGSRIVSLLSENGRLTGVALADGRELAVNGLFALRDAISLGTLLPGLETEGAHIKVDRGMATNVPGVFAAGDCTGRPYQYAKAVGEGNTAAHSVIEWLAKQ
ncbi:MAG: NAD(P)/FAD-dependent oxidoreductase, partial [Lachnospiraceae bacterium]|nr:NAD(P)/FAD-dependent oxidoreductase [Lachnospiraceae bacterium]